MISRRRLLAFVAILAAILMSSAIVQYIILPDYKSGGMNEWVGKGATPEQSSTWAIRTENGNNLRIEVEVPSGYLIDIYFMTLDNLMRMRSNQSFEYIHEASQMGVSHYFANITLDSSVEVYDIVVVGNDSNPSSVLFTLRTLQSHYPLQLQTVAQLGQLFLQSASTFLFFLIIFALYRNSQEKTNAKLGKRTKWNSIYAMSLYVTVALLTIQLASALFLSLLVSG